MNGRPVTGEAADADLKLVDKLVALGLGGCAFCVMRMHVLHKKASVTLFTLTHVVRMRCGAILVPSWCCPASR